MLSPIAMIFPVRLRATGADTGGVMAALSQGHRTARQPLPGIG